MNRVVPPEELLPPGRSFARDILSCDARTVRAIERLHRDGGALALGDALALGGRAWIEHARPVRAADVAGRRRAVQERGRSQSRRQGCQKRGSEGSRSRAGPFLPPALARPARGDAATP